MKNSHRLLRMAFTVWLVLVHCVANCCARITAGALSSVKVVVDHDYDTDVVHHLGIIDQAIHWLQSNGYRVCRDSDHQTTSSDMPVFVPHCADISEERYLIAMDEEEELPVENDSSDFFNVLLNLIGVFTCVAVSAVATGLTLGMLGLDPLMLLIKQRAGETPEERKMATDLLPIVKQHHLLLVTLLLMNACSNESLPIFLEALVPPSVAILLSVTCVLFFGEIIPSAIFTGPNQLIIASRLSPLVKVCLWLLYPIAGPVAKFLDILVSDDEDRGAYKRGELSALIRIQYEERLAAKRKRKKERAQVRTSILSVDSSIKNQQTHINNSDNSSSWRMFSFWFGRKGKKNINSDTVDGVYKKSQTHPRSASAASFTGETAVALRNSALRSSRIGALNFDPTDGCSLAKLIEKEVDMRSVINQIEYVTDRQRQHQDRRDHKQSQVVSWDAVSVANPKARAPSVLIPVEDGHVSKWAGRVDTESLHYNEVLIMEGALSMKTRVAMDLVRPKRLTYRLPHDLILSEHNLIDIYASGFSRVPVYYRSDSVEKETDSLTAKDAIMGVLITKQLIVVKPDDCRALHTLPLYIPNVVGPQTRLVDLLNELQTGGSRMRGGHMALVCANVKEATTALDRGDPIPSACGWMGIITLEDVIEALLQEEIYDEFDKAQYKEQKLGKMVLAAWNTYKLKKNLKALCETSRQIKQLMTTDAVSTERTALLSNIIKETA